MSVIVGRALPLVEDGLKPVHRRVLYSMGENGFRPDRSYVKCARVVGEVMGNYHPHGDSSIYDALVRLAQPWSLRYPLIDGQGNFGSRGNDPAAAMRYCVTGDTLVATPYGEVAIANLMPEIVPDSTVEADLKVVGLHGAPVRATAVHHSGTHPVLRVRAGDRELRCTGNHPLLTLVTVDGVPTLLWKLAEELVPGDLMAVDRSHTGPGARTQVLPCVPSPEAVRGPVDPARLVPEAPAVDVFAWVAVDEVTPAGSAPVYSLRVDSPDHAFVTNGFVSHNTECRLSPLAMAMLQDIDEDTVDFSANYDGKTQEPDVLPSRVPNLLINGSCRHRRRHGHQHPAAQPAGGRRRRRLGTREPRGHRGGAARRADGAHQGPRLPDRRAHRRPGRDRAGLPHGPRVGADARRRRGRGRRQGPHDPRRHRAALPGQPGQPHRVDRRAGPRRQARGHRRDQRRVQRPHRHAHRGHAQARRGGQGRAEQPLQAHAAAVRLRREHAGHRRRGAAHPAAGPGGAQLHPPPDRGHRPADALPAAQGRGARPHPARLRQGAGPAGRGHRADPRRRRRWTSPGRA